MTTRSFDETSGWVIFAGTMLALAGVFKVIYGLAMVFNSDWVVFTTDGAWLLDLTAWGWITLIAGVILIIAAWGVLTGQTWARVVGIIVASLAAINALFTISIFPLWGIVVLALNVLVIYGLAVHGDEVADV